MVLASRQIERWAWKYGQGELHAGFQHFSSLGEQLDTYEALSADTDLTIHVYGRPDEPVPETLDVVEHPVEECELAKRWFLVLGGAIDERATRALVAQRDTRQTWTGFWTHRTDLVEDAMDEIEAQRATLQ
jgi:DICT domain-containing protein